MKVVLPIAALVVLGLGLLTYQLRWNGPEEAAAPASRTVVDNRTTDRTIIRERSTGQDTGQRGVPLEPQRQPQPQTDMGGAGVRLAPNQNNQLRSGSGTGTTSGPAGAPAGGQAVSLQYDEATLTRDARASLVGQTVASTPLGNATVRSVDIQLENNEVIATGQAQVGAMTLPYTITGTVSVQQGRPAVQVLDARAGGFALPDDSIAGIEQTLQAQLEQMLAQERLRLQQISIRNGVLLVTGTRQ